MKIILCKSQLEGPISGADETLVTYAAQLQKAGQDVSVLLMYLHAEEDQYYQRLLESGVPVNWIASNLAQTSLGTGRKLASRMFYRFPGSKHFIRRRTQPVLTAIASRYYKQCRNFLEKQKPDLVHVMTPNAGAEVMIRAGHDAGLPACLIKPAEEFLGGRDPGRDQQGLGDGGVPDLLRAGRGAVGDEVASGQVGPGGETVAEAGQFQPGSEEAGGLGALARCGNDKHVLTLHCRTPLDRQNTARSFAAKLWRIPPSYVLL